MKEINKIKRLFAEDKFSIKDAEELAAWLTDWAATKKENSGGAVKQFDDPPPPPPDNPPHKPKT